MVAQRSTSMSTPITPPCPEARAPWIRGCPRDTLITRCRSPTSAGCFATFTRKPFRLTEACAASGSSSNAGRQRPRAPRRDRRRLCGPCGSRQNGAFAGRVRRCRGELVKQASWHPSHPVLHHYRTYAGDEGDVVLEARRGAMRASRSRRRRPKEHAALAAALHSRRSLASYSSPGLGLRVLTRRRLVQTKPIAHRRIFGTR